MLPAPATHLAGAGRFPEGHWDGLRFPFWSVSGRSLARGPHPQVPQWHPRVAKGASTGTLARRPLPQVPQWHPRLAKGDFWPVFGTATLPTGTSVPSPRGEEGFYRHFGTATLPTGTSVASSRGKEGLLAGLRHGDLQLKHFWGRVACRRKGNRYL